MNKLWYLKGAKRWREALPIGNGESSAMVFGGKSTEKLTFNDTTLWSGFPRDYNKKNGVAKLNEVREKIFSGKNDEAEKIAQKELDGFYSETFLPLGMLKMKFSSLSKDDFKRELDLTTAIHTVTSKGVKREAFASFADKVVVYHIVSAKPFSLSITGKSQLKSDVFVDSGLKVCGNAPDHVTPNYVRSELRPVKYKEGKGMAFALCADVKTDGKVKYQRKKIVVSNAREVTIFCATATGFIGFNKEPVTDRKYALSKCRAKLKKVKGKYEDVKQRHLDDYTPLWNKSSLSLSETSELPTNLLLKSVKSGDESTALTELLYNYGKYMMIAGSRKGGQPLNLQGQWNNSVRPPWSSNYTVNINAQMNYWGASRANLNECIEPFINMVFEVMENGKKTAQSNYGCRGFACNHNVDIWRKTPPCIGTVNYMLEPLCGVWLANELFTHYQNGGLEEYRDKIFEIVKQAALFASDYLVLHNGEYVICPSASPENVFIKDGKKNGIDYACAFDMGLVKQVFANYLEMGIDDELTKDVKEKQSKLYPFKQGKTGILEWHDDFVPTQKGHRHFSPLYAFYPAKIIGYYGNSEQTKWIKDLLSYRLENAGHHIGWSAAWAICLAARLHDEKTAENVINGLLQNAVFINLFCVHPPFLFQIDGNLGFVAGINEMLLYEENGAVELLPALPEKWKSGEVKDMLVRGTHISFKWEKGKVVSVSSDKQVRILNSNISENVQYSQTVTLIKKEELF